MKKTQKKLSIDVVTVRRLDSELTPEQLQGVDGAGRDPNPSKGCSPATIIKSVGGC